MVTLHRTLTTAACLVLSAASIGTGRQPDQPEQPPQPQTGDTPASQAANGGNFGQMLLTGLRTTEGCLGAEAAQLAPNETRPDWTGTRLVIMAWFENKAAALRWYNSRTHQFMLRGVGAGGDREPMAHIKDESAPIMVVATVTFGGEGKLPGMMPASQISIEMYTPLPGGASFNGRLAPDGFDIPHMRSGEDTPADDE